MSEGKDIDKMFNSYCEQLKNDLKKMEEEYNNMIDKFNSIIDNYSISVEHSRLVQINQVFGEISVLIHVGRQMFYNSDANLIGYTNEFREEVFKALNISAYVIQRILNREDPADSMFFYGVYRNLKKLVYEMIDKRVSH